MSEENFENFTSYAHRSRHNSSVIAGCYVAMYESVKQAEYEAINAEKSLRQSSFRAIGIVK
jgi:hypothetical protein